MAVENSLAIFASEKSQIWLFGFSQKVSDLRCSSGLSTTNRLPSLRTFTDLGEVI